MLANAFQLVIQSGRANAVAAPEPESARMLAALQSIDPRWRRVLKAGGLVLMLPQGGAPEGPAYIYFTPRARRLRDEFL